MKRRPNLKLQKPAQDAIIDANAHYIIKWKFFRVGQVKIEYSTDGETFSDVATVPARRKKYTWTTPSIGGTYYIRISSNSNPNISDVNSFTVPDPSTVLLIPARDYFVPGQLALVTWQSTGCPSNSNGYVSFIYHLASPESGEYMFNDPEDGPNETKTWTVPNVITNDGWARLNITSADRGITYAFNDVIPIRIKEAMDFQFVTDYTTVNAADLTSVEVTSNNSQPDLYTVWLSLKNKDFLQYSSIGQVQYNWSGGRPLSFTIPISASPITTAPAGTYQAKLKVTSGSSINFEDYAGVSDTFTLIVS